VEVDGKLLRHSNASLAFPTRLVQPHSSERASRDAAEASFLLNCFCYCNGFPFDRGKRYLLPFCL